MRARRSIAPAILLALAACANTSAIEQAAESKSHFEGAVYPGKTVNLDKPTPGAESYRLYEQGATGFVSLQSVRSEVEERASAHCDRSGKVMHGITERDATPPYMLGNFPRVELVFECVDGPRGAAAVTETDKYGKLAHLKALLDNGTLTQKEFDEEKAKILSSP
jgi:Short C-terminal domain